MTAVVVNSCAQFAGATVPMLLFTLCEAGVPPEHVFVVVGDAPARDGTIGPPHYRVRALWRPWSNVDNNGFLWVTADDGKEALRDFEWLFYTHDTVVVDPTFYGQVVAECARAPPDTNALKLYGPWSMSMGLYRVKAVWAATEAVQSLKNLDSARTLDIKRAGTEDVVFSFLQPHVGVLNTRFEIEGKVVDVYGTSTPRVIEHWPVPGIKKLKANWSARNMTCAL